MKNSFLKPLVFLAVFVFIVSAACALTGGDTTNEPVVIVVTATSPAVNETEAPAEPEATLTPEVTPTKDPPDLFTEEFDNGIGQYFGLLINPDTLQPEDQFSSRWKSVTLGGASSGALQVTLNDYNLYYYLLYNPYNFSNIRLDAAVDNLSGNNTNSYSLICRYTKDYGWYELNVSSGGEWAILYYDALMAKSYLQLADGGSTAIRMGKDTNKYSFVCKGTSLILYINDVYVTTVEHKDLDTGRVGFGFKSFDSYPIIMKMPWFKISAP